MITFCLFGFFWVNEGADIMKDVQLGGGAQVDNVAHGPLWKNIIFMKIISKCIVIGFCRCSKLAYIC